jgi:hypothetical protein
MERYIGMDVHAASCTLAVISEKGRKLKDFRRNRPASPHGRGSSPWSRLRLEGNGGNPRDAIRR